MKQKFHFLCGNYENLNYIYATKFGEHDWHYFENADTHLSVHKLLPQVLDSLVGKLKSVKSIEVLLDEVQSINYYRDGKFIFNNKELETHMKFTGHTVDRTERSKKNIKKTNQLVFISGQTNPLIFLSEFEKCSDVLADNDKKFKIREFVDDCDQISFSEMFFTTDWPSMRNAFIKAYAGRFTENKKVATNIDFRKEHSLRSYVDRKLKSLSMYTTMPLVNQMEVVLMDLPDEVSNLFLVNEKLTCQKSEILDFCDVIYDFAKSFQQNSGNQETVTRNSTDQPEPQTNVFEIFNYDSDILSEVSEIQSSGTSTGGSKSGRGRCNSLTSVSSEASTGERHNASVNKRKNPSDRVIKRGRGRPRKNLPMIKEALAENNHSIASTSKSFFK